MTFSPQWQSLYKAGRQVISWPWSDLVSNVKRFMPDLEGMRVLELGCGTGCNAPFFMTEGAIYGGIEGSQAAIEFANIKPPHRLTRGDFTKMDFYGIAHYDIICDRAAVTHNDTESIQRCLAAAHKALSRNGLYIGIDWFSAAHWSSGLGIPVDDFTRRDIQHGQFRDVGVVHFSTKQHMEELFKDFKILELTHKNSEYTVTGINVASWDIVAMKE